jgi:hypothetical protein
MLHRVQTSFIARTIARPLVKLQIVLSFTVELSFIDVLMLNKSLVRDKPLVRSHIAINREEANQMEKTLKL